MSDPATLRAISEACRAGMIDLGAAVQMALVTIGGLPQDVNVFEYTTGYLDRELRDLAHHVIHGIPGAGVTSWTEGVLPEEQIGLDRLVQAARDFGYRDDDLVTPS